MTSWGGGLWGWGGIHLGILHHDSRILEAQHSRVSELGEARRIVLLGLLGSRTSLPESLSVPGARLSTLPSNLHHSPARWVRSSSS